MSSGQHKVYSTQGFAGIQYGYIVIPKDVDRTKFIEQSYRWERVSILIERGGGLIHECYITRNAIAEIEFPLTYDNLGSCICFLTDPFSGHPVIFGVLSKEDESQLLREGFFKITKSYQGGSVTISGDAKTGILNMAVNGGSMAQLNISVSNADKSAKVNLRCSGDVSIEPEGLFKINSGAEAMVLGDELKTQLDKTNTYLSDLYSALYTALQAIDAVVPGVSLAFQTSMLGKSPGNYDNIKSAESFLD